MNLGSRGSLGRCLMVWTTGSTVLASAGLAVRPAAMQAWAHRTTPERLPLDQALTDLAAVVLLVSAVWAWLALTLTVLEAVRAVGTPVPVGRRRPWHLPQGARRLVLAGCGVALVTGLAQPALASPGHRAPRGAATLSGLPLPDRATVPRPRRPVSHGAPDSVPRAAVGRTAPRQTVVRPGDCLWSIAARVLPPGAPDSAIDARWRIVYAANRSAVGPDPDQLRPGLRLSLPPLPRKDPS